MNESNENLFLELPIIPLRGIVVFPKMVLHFDVGRKKSIKALQKAMDDDQKVFLVCQKDASVDEPNIDDMYDVGVICTIRQMMRIPGSENMRVVVEGDERATLYSFTSVKPYIGGLVEIAGDNNSILEISEDEDKAYQRIIKREFERYASLMPKISNEVIAKVISIKDSGELADFVCSNTFLDYYEKQDVLSALDPSERICQLVVYLKKENNALEIESEIQEKVQNEIDKSQREYYLREEMKVISEALGESDNPLEEAEEYKSKVSALKCLEIPFGKYTKDSINLEKSRKILDKEHYGLDKVKERIVDSLAVYKRNPEFNGQILCLAGPPGVGKTSIVKSLAKSMGRKYVRIALGGIHDEAEIRGHRKTYIGSMPGRIVEAVIKSGVMNPIILLDEIDKVGNDFKGDPSSALLEALDPEQNNSFADHYIEFPLDLSRVLFITTANDVSAIAGPLYDRMEVIELNSYTALEKFYIAKKHLVKKEMIKHSLTSKEFKISDDAINILIENYTREAGVRTLEKQIATLCRKATVSLESGAKSFKVTDKNIEEYLGKKKFSDDLVSKEDQVGTVNGLAWTSVGGTMLPIEVSVLNGTGKIELTGNLGDVMKESAKTAVSYIRSKASEYGIDEDFYKNKDIHIHAPEAAVPKDGPSAGLAITTAIVSELTGIAIKSNVAMTGEISLKGKALAIGGLKEKSMAAYKAGCDTVIIPQDNKKDLDEISDEVKQVIDFISVKNFDEVLPIALVSRPIKKKEVKENIIVTDKTSKTNVVTQ